MSVNEKMTAIADRIRHYAYETGKLTLDDMANKIEMVNLSGYNNGFYDGRIMGFDEGYNKATEDNLIYYMTGLSSVFIGAVLPENVVIRVKELSNANGRFTYAFNNATGAKHIKLICDNPNATINMTSSFAISAANTRTLEVIDLTEFYRKITSLQITFQYQVKLKSILGALDLSECTNLANPFRDCRALENIEFVENSINISINFQWSTNLSKASLTSIINGLNADVTGQTLTLPKTAVNNAFGINVDNASTYPEGSEYYNLRNSKSNWTFSYA